MNRRLAIVLAAAALLVVSVRFLLGDKPPGKRISELPPEVRGVWMSDESGTDSSWEFGATTVALAFGGRQSPEHHTIERIYVTTDEEHGRVFWVEYGHGRRSRFQLHEHKPELRFVSSPQTVWRPEDEVKRKLERRRDNKKKRAGG